MPPLIEHSIGADDRLRELEERIAADQAAMVRLLEVGNLCVRADSGSEECLTAIVDAAIALTAADRGNLQLVNDASGTLVIAAQRGFDEPFLRFFANVQVYEASACAAASIGSASSSVLSATIICRFLYSTSGYMPPLGSTSKGFCLKK